MIGIKIWFVTILILIAFGFTLGPLGVAMIIIAPVFSLPSIPLLYLFWQPLMWKQHSKLVIMLCTCFAAVFISFLCVMLAACYVGGISMLSEWNGIPIIFTAMASFAAVISVCINTNGICRYVQRKHIMKDPGNIRRSIDTHLSDNTDAIRRSIKDHLSNN